MNRSGSLAKFTWTPSGFIHFVRDPLRFIAPWTPEKWNSFRKRRSLDDGKDIFRKPDLEDVEEVDEEEKDETEESEEDEEEEEEEEDDDDDEEDNDEDEDDIDDDDDDDDDEEEEEEGPQKIKPLDVLMGVTQIRCKTLSTKRLKRPCMKILAKTYKRLKR